MPNEMKQNKNIEIKERKKTLEYSSYGSTKMPVTHMNR